MRFIMFIIVIILPTLITAQEAQNSYVEYLPQNLFDAVALIETAEHEKNADNEETVTYRPIASSLLLSINNDYYIITAGHVGKNNKNLYLQLTGAKKRIRRFSLDSMKTELKTDWRYDNRLDICALKIDPRILLASVEKAINATNLVGDPHQYMLGTGIYIVGYPASVSKIDYHVVRKGSISAFIDDDQFLLDCFVFPGNSGGPVFLSAVPDIVASSNYSGIDLEMIIPGRESKFLGIVTDYLPYSELAVSRQTNKARISFEENSGLSIAVSAKAIIRFLKDKK